MPSQSFSYGLCRALLYRAVTGKIKLELQAGKANPAPPVGPALGSKVCATHRRRLLQAQGHSLNAAVWHAKRCETGGAAQKCSSLFQRSSTHSSLQHTLPTGPTRMFCLQSSCLLPVAWPFYSHVLASKQFTYHCNAHPTYACMAARDCRARHLYLSPVRAPLPARV